MAFERTEDFKEKYKTADRLEDGEFIVTLSMTESEDRNGEECYLLRAEAIEGDNSGAESIDTLYFFPDDRCEYDDTARIKTKIAEKLISQIEVALGTPLKLLPDDLNKFPAQKYKLTRTKTEKGEKTYYNTKSIEKA